MLFAWPRRPRSRLWSPGKENLVNKGTAEGRSVTAFSPLKVVLNSCWVVGPVTKKPAVRACSGHESTVERAAQMTQPHPKGLGLEDTKLALSGQQTVASHPKATPDWAHPCPINTFRHKPVWPISKHKQYGSEGDTQTCLALPQAVACATTEAQSRAPDPRLPAGLSVQRSL